MMVMRGEFLLPYRLPVLSVMPEVGVVVVSSRWTDVAESVQGAAFRWERRDGVVATFRRGIV